MLRRLLPIALVLLSACTLAAGDMDGLFDPSLDTDLPDNTDTDGESLYTGPTFWGLSGDLTVADGLVALDLSTITASFYDAQGQPWYNEALEGPSCSLDVVEAVEGPALSEDEVSMLAWWQLTLDPDTELPCAWPIPTAEATGDSDAPQLILGLGPLDVRLAASMAAAELSTDLPLYGLYSLHPASGGDRVYVFGVGGTQAQFDGTDKPVDEPPPADGRYALQTLLLLPVPEASRN